MGASSSTVQSRSTEQQEVENEASSTGALPVLRRAFGKLADPETNAVPRENLQQCFSLVYKGQSDASNIHKLFPVLLDHLGSSIVDEIFKPAKGQLTWIEFVRGYNRCCARMPASMSLTMLLRVLHSTLGRTNMAINLEFEFDDTDGKINGSLLPRDVLLLLFMCWCMSWDCRSLKHPEGKASLSPPNLNHLVLSAITSCAKIDSGLNVWDSDFSGSEVQIPVGKFVTWVLSTVPCLSDCLSQFLHARLQNQATAALQDESVLSDSSVGDVLLTTECDNNILTPGRAWAVCLTQRSTINEEISELCFPRSKDALDETLLYRSSAHGKGLNRFWSRVEGYKGPMLILVAASSGLHEGSSIVSKWVIGALTNKGFENKDLFYGSSGCLYAISPVFHVFPPSGKEKNFVYSHLHPAGRVYEPHPKPVGIAFGGTMGNERIFIDEDFARVTIRHHATDKTYQHGPLLPDQGFLAVEGLVSEVEVWGLGGHAAKKVQDSFKKREELFTEQRRKVDLKTFASWEDSPEKMMMDMMSDPNAVRREDR